MEPDLLDLLGLAITEVGGVQLSIESARLHWPLGSTRVTVLLQGAYDREVEVALELAGGATQLARRVRVPQGEVRRVRLDVELPGGAAPLELRVQASVPGGATRIRPSWVKPASLAEPAGSTSAFDAVFSALKQAFGKGEKRGVDVAPEEARLPVVLEAVAGERALAAAEDALWMPGMPLPGSTPLRTEAGPAPAAPAPANERPECPGCFTRQYVELVRATNRCPSCGVDWAL